MSGTKFELVMYRKNRKKPIWCIKSLYFYGSSLWIDDFLDPHKNKMIIIDGCKAYKFSNKTLAEESLLCATMRFG